MSKPLDPLHVEVRFGTGIPGHIQGAAMLAFENTLREMTGDKLWIEVFKEAKGDDSKLRAAMTPEQRARL